jgi:hypothetical protein
MKTKRKISEAELNAWEVKVSEDYIAGRLTKAQIADLKSVGFPLAYLDEERERRFKKLHTLNGYAELDHRTFAQISKDTGVRDDEHMIYEMLYFSQYEDGSVLNCRDSKYPVTYGPEEVAVGDFHVDVELSRWGVKHDLIRNAKAAVKNGTTKNLAPRV